MKKVLILLLALTVLFTVLADHGGKETIVICASSEQYRNDAMQEQLSQSFPEYNIIVMYMSTGKAAAKVFAEGPATEIDMLVGLETGYLHKISGNLADISGLSRIPYVEGITPADNDNLWITWERQAGAIIVNKDILAKHGLEKDTSIKRYTDYKQMLAENDITLASIATESGIHAEIALHCIDNGVNVIIEKPMAMSIDDAEEIIRRSEAKGVKVSEQRRIIRE